MLDFRFLTTGTFFTFSFPSSELHCSSDTHEIMIKYDLSQTLLGECCRSSEKKVFIGP